MNHSDLNMDDPEYERQKWVASLQNPTVENMRQTANRVGFGGRSLPPPPPPKTRDPVQDPFSAQQLRSSRYGIFSPSRTRQHGYQRPTEANYGSSPAAVASGPEGAMSTDARGFLTRPPPPHTFHQQATPTAQDTMAYGTQPAVSAEPPARFNYDSQGMTFKDWMPVDRHGNQYGQQYGGFGFPPSPAAFGDGKLFRGSLQQPPVSVAPPVLPPQPQDETPQMSTKAFGGLSFLEGTPKRPQRNVKSTIIAARDLKLDTGPRAEIAALYKRYQDGDGDVYLTAARFRMFATVASTAWQYLSGETRANETKEALVVSDDPRCPEDASVSIRVDVQTLLALDTVEVELTEDDDDPSDLSGNGSIYELITDTASTLLDLMLSGVCDHHHRRHLLLGNVDTILRGRVPFYAKVYTAALAWTIWPNRVFTNKSKALSQFIAAHEAHLDAAKAQAADQPKGDGTAPSASLPGFEKYTPEIFDEKAANAVLDHAHRHVAPENDNVRYVRVNAAYFKDEVYDALCTLPHDASDFQQEQWDTWHGYQKNGTFTYQLLEAKAWKIVSEVIRLHEHGCILGGGSHDWCERHERDQGLTCPQRLRQIISALANKFVAKDCLSREHLLRLVAAPNEVVKKKTDSHHNSKRRAYRTKAARTTTKGKEGDESDVDPDDENRSAMPKTPAKKLMTSTHRASTAKKRKAGGEHGEAEPTGESPTKKLRRTPKKPTKASGTRWDDEASDISGDNIVVSTPTNGSYVQAKTRKTAKTAPATPQQSSKAGSRVTRSSVRKLLSATRPGEEARNDEEDSESEEE
ncbi:hypothetical protein LTR85_008188 [Meristemomyces frigidus]|nr:hypothetical protein LTR85_008188 [Meristemomyces frigidus]